MGSITSGKETQPSNSKTSGGALAVVAVIQCWETAGRCWWQPIIHRLQQDAGLGELRGGKPRKGQAWWDSSVLLHHSSAERGFGGPGLLGQLCDLEGGGGRRRGHPSLPCPLLAPAHSSGSGGWMQSAVLPFWMISRDQKTFSIAIALAAGPG